MRGILLKIRREIFGFSLAFGLGLMAFHILLAYIAPTILSELSGRFLQTMLIKTVLKGLFGGDVGQTLGTIAIVSLSWIHPIPLVVLWSQSIALWSRMPAGEIEKGTLDIYLSQPVSRFQIFLGETIAWLVSGLILIGMALVGNRIGNASLADEYRISYSVLLKLAANLYALYLAVGGFACFCSSLCNRRSSAMGFAFCFVAFSYLLHTLIPFWSTAKQIAFLSVMDYYNPMIIIQNPSWPIRNIAALVSVSFFFWLAGLAVWERRNLNVN